MKETNKLIAEFMGATSKEYSYTTNCGVVERYYEYEMYGIIECIKDGIDEQHFFTPADMLFYDSWDWLMPVVRDCHKVIENYGYDDDTRNFIDDEIFNLDNTLSEFFNDDKEAIYNRVVEFIKFYNQNK